MSTRIFSAAVMTFALAAAAPAQITTTQKIAVLDMQAALATTKEGQKAAADLRAKYTPKQQEFQQRQSALEQKQDQYKRTENTMSDEAKAKLAGEIDSLSRTLQRDTQDAQEDMNQDQQRVVQELGAKMLKIVTKYAQDHQYQLVFDVAGQPNNIYFASNAIEITRDIIALYDQTYPVAPSPATTSAAPPAAHPAPAGAANRAPANAGGPR